MWIRKVGLKIRKEIEEIPSNRKHYQTRVNLKNIMENVSPTLLTLLCEISNSFKSSLMAGMIGNMITSTVNQLAQPIQVGIGVLLQRKSLIDTLYRFGVCSSYDEVLRFKTSAAVAASKNATIMGISSSESGLVQVIADNFDANISSQNGLVSTHGLAVIVTQQEGIDAVPQVSCIERVDKGKNNECLKAGIAVKRYSSQKKAPMP